MDSNSNSEDSFAWTDASDDTSGSKNMSTKSKTIQSGEESESGKHYKRNLQKRLFSGCDENVDYHQPKKRKLSQLHSNDENGASPNKKKIKIEPESDIDSKKEIKSSINHNTNTSNDSYEESLLDDKVKNEQNFVLTPIKSKIKKKKGLSKTNDTFMTQEDECEAPSTQIHSSTQLEDPSNTIAEKSNHTFERHVKKKNSKKKDKHLKCEIGSSVTGEYSAEEVDNASQETHNMSTDSIQRKNKSKSKQAQVNDPLSIMNGDISDNDKSLVSYSKVPSKNLEQKSKISDRIMFEEENDFNEDVTEINITTEKTSKLQKFIEMSNMLYRTFNSTQVMPHNVTDDDDLWLIKCPKEVNVNAFLNKKWILDNRCKVKLDSVKYEGSLDDKKTNISLVSSKERKIIIQNFPINGCVRLHRRIPKLQVQQDMAPANNRTSFMRLPDTTCRHPLLGAHYKRALRLPSHVAARFRDAHTLQASTGKRKNKYVKLENEISISNVEPSVGSQDSFETVSSSKNKKRKHRHTDPNQKLEEPRRKKPKFDPKSAATWDSEKAIEETLFNC